MNGLQYGESTGSTIQQTNNPICDTKYYTKVTHLICLNIQFYVFSYDTHNSAPDILKSFAICCMFFASVEKAVLCAD